MGGMSKELHCGCASIIHNLPPGKTLPRGLCDRDSFWVGVYAFKAASTIYAPLFLLSAVLSGKISNLNFVATKLLPSICRSSFFIACTGFFWVRFACLVRQLTGGHYRLNYFIGPFFAAIIGLLIEKKERRSELNVYICQQSLEVAFRMAQTRGWVRPIKGGMSLLFAVAISTLYYFHHKHRQLLPGSTKGLLTLAFGTEERPDFLELQLLKAHTFIKARVSAVLLGTSRGEKKAQPLHTSSSLCQHACGCRSYALAGFFRSFLLGYGISNILSLFPLLLNPRKGLQLRTLAKSLLNRNILRLGLFLGCLNGAARNTQCLLRWTRGVEDGYNQAIAGFIAGFSFLINGSNEIAMYVASKAAESMFKLLVSNGTIRPIPNGELLTFGLACATIFYASVWEPYVLRPSYFKFLHKASATRYGIITRNFAKIREEVGVPAPAIYATWKEKTKEFFSKLP